MVKKILNNDKETINKSRLHQSAKENLEQRKFIGEDGQVYYGPYTPNEYIEKLERSKHKNA